MNFRLIKIVEKMKAIFAIFLIISSGNVSAFFWDSKIKILCYGEKSVDMIFTYEFKDGEIYQEVIVPKKETKSGKDELIGLSKMEDCTIKNSKNWICGGKSTYQINGVFRSESHTVYEGRYKYMPANSIPDLCNKRVQSK